MTPALDHSKRESVKLRRLFFIKKEKKDIDMKTDQLEKKYKYYVLKMSWDQALDVKKYFRNENLINDSISDKLRIRKFEPDIDTEGFIHTYNKAFITAPDPYRSLTRDDVKYFDPESIFIAILYGKIVGFIYLTLEPLIKKGREIGKQGVIAGLGVDPKYRRRRIGLLLASCAMEYFRKNKVLELVCEVYHENRVSYNFIRNFGFTRTGTIYI
ncbi:MAG: GNAT family N-acetyltransferase [Candidatus Hodarchaeota archaeon]